MCLRGNKVLDTSFVCGSYAERNYDNNGGPYYFIKFNLNYEKIFTYNFGSYTFWFRALFLAEE